MSKFFKYSGILDPIQKIMCPDIWTPERKLWPHIKTQVLDALYKIIHQDHVKEIFLIGSTTGFQWTETSDIDLNISLNPPELIDDKPLKIIRDKTNGFLANGTRHPVNFFWVSWYGKAQFWGDSVFGVYDVLSDTWVADPGISESMRDPNIEYQLDLISAKQIVNNFERMIISWKKSLHELHSLSFQRKDSLSESVRIITYKRKLNEVRNRTQNLIEFCHDWDRKRKYVYAIGFGVPRKTWQNIVFKMFEESRLSEWFEFFKELKADDYVTEFANALKESGMLNKPSTPSDEN